MKVSDLFYVTYGINLELNKCELSDDGVNFVSRTSQNNGVVARVKLIPGKEPQPAGVLSCAGGGSVLSTFVQLEPFYSGRDLYILTPKREMSFNEKLFYAQALSFNAYRYNYGRQANKTLPDIELPDVVPDWVYKKEIKFNRVRTNIDISNLSLDTDSWDYYDIGGEKGLFEVSGTKTTSLDELELHGVGDYPYVTTKATENGVTGFYDFYTEDGGVITIDSAVAGYAAYQCKSFSASDHVEKLTPKFEMDKYIALFIVTILNMEQYKYSYGRKANQGNISNTKIKLPTKNNIPDWDRIRLMMKHTKYADLL